MLLRYRMAMGLICFSSMLPQTYIEAPSQEQVVVEQQSMKSVSEREKSIIIEELSQEDYILFLDNKEVKVDMDFDSFDSNLEFTAIPVAEYVDSDYNHLSLDFDSFRLTVNNSGSDGNLVVKEICIKDNTVWTKRGIGVGNTLEDLEAVYGKGTHGTQGKSDLYFYNSNFGCLQFRVTDDMITEFCIREPIILSDTPPNSYLNIEHVASIVDTEELQDLSEEEQLVYLNEKQAEIENAKEYVTVRNSIYGNKKLGIFYLDIPFELETDKSQLDSDTFIEYSNSRDFSEGLVDTKLTISIRAGEDTLGIGYTDFIDDFDKENTCPEENIVENTYYCEQLEGYRYKGMYSTCIFENDANALHSCLIVLQVSQTKLIEIDIMCSDKELISSGDLITSILDSYTI